MQAADRTSNVVENVGVGVGPSPTGSRVLRSVTILLLISSVILNIDLARKINSCRRLQALRAAERLLKIGATVPPFTVKGLGGHQEVVAYRGTSQPTVLYVFTPPCSWCTRNLDNFKTLVDKENNQYRFIGLSLSEETLPEYVAKNNLMFPVYSGLSAETKTAYKLSGTPQTIVVSPEGRVLQNWMGAYVGGQKSQVEAFFHVSLPGLTPLPSPQAGGNRASAASN